VIDPVSFLLGMLTQEFLARSLKKSQVVSIMIAFLFMVILFSILVQIGAFDAIQIWWAGLER